MKSPEQIGTDTLVRLARQAERNKVAGSALRAQIRAAMLDHAGTEPLTAKAVRNQLLRVPLPSIRAVQQHMRSIRAQSAALRSADGAESAGRADG